MSILKVSIIYYLLFPVAIMLLIISVSTAEGKDSIYKIHNEIRISSDDMNCNYVGVNYSKYFYHFEYPKLLIIDNPNPLVAFIDENSKQLIFADVTDQGAKLYDNLSADDSKRRKWPIEDYSKDEGWHEWPIIFTRENKIFLASIQSAGKHKKLIVYLLNRDTNKLLLYIDKDFLGSPRCRISGLFPYKENLMLIGDCNYLCWRYVLEMFTTTNFPVFYHNVSFLTGENDNLEIRPIEEKGCYSAGDDEYALLNSGIIFGAWVRRTKAVKPKFDEIIYYSINRNGTKWEKPVELYAVKDSERYYRIDKLSLTDSGESAFLLWQDSRKGIYFAELKDGKKPDIKEISNMKLTTPDKFEPLFTSSHIKIASDIYGNAYGLFTWNNGKEYQLFLKVRINGQWMKEVVVEKGEGILKRPDMKVDNNGIIHIVYIKSKDPKKSFGEFGCYYKKLTRVKSDEAE